MGPRSKSSKKYKKGGACSASDYGMYIYGMDQFNDPAQGNVVHFNNPLAQLSTTTPSNQTGGKKKGGESMAAMIASAGDTSSKTAELLNPQIPATVESQSVTATTRATQGGRKKTNRKRRHSRKSKRKYH
jgi:hypothetical protein